MFQEEITAVQTAAETKVRLLRKRPGDFQEPKLSWVSVLVLLYVWL